jgi:glycosyltransferase involved in cell wall biosynthesis
MKPNRRRHSKPPRILIITEAGNARPSGMVRAFIYRELFRSRRMRVDYLSRQSPFLAGLSAREGFLFDRLLTGGMLTLLLGRLNLFVARCRERMIVLYARRGYDVIYLQKAGSWYLTAKLKKATRARVVFDLNDGLWLPANADYADGKIREILRTVDAVTCDNPFGLTFARNYNANTFLVPDPAQVEKFDPYRASVPKSQNPLVLGWIGSPVTLCNLFAIWEALEEVFRRHDSIVLRLIGTGYNRALLPRFERVRYEVVPYYSPADMIRYVLSLSIGLFPQFDVEDSQARGLLKATIYMSGEAAVIASPRGQVPALIQDNLNGLWADSKAEWVEKLDRLIREPALRQRLAAAGLETVRRDFSLARTFECLLTALVLNQKEK